MLNKVIQVGIGVIDVAFRVIGYTLGTQEFAVCVINRDNTLQHPNLTAIFIYYGFLCFWFRRTDTRSV